MEFTGEVKRKIIDLRNFCTRARNFATWGAVMIKAWEPGPWKGKIVEEGAKKG